MEKHELIKSIVDLGNHFNQISNDTAFLNTVYVNNNWFTLENSKLALQSWAKLLNSDDLNQWLNKYTFNKKELKIGILMAGNIPLVSLHDLLCVILSGQIAIVKISSDDKILMTNVCQWFWNYHDYFKQHIILQEQLKNIDALIATGNNNTALHFEYYFKHIPKIIRKNRTSIAVINENNTSHDFEQLGKDVFTYFGLGCRNVSKIWIHHSISMSSLLDTWETYSECINHNKWANNYTYHKAILLLNMVPHLDTLYLVAQENDQLHSPLGTIYFQYYQSIETVLQNIKHNEEQIQAIASDTIELPNALAFGTLQFPSLSMYADNIDTLKFIENLTF